MVDLRKESMWYVQIICWFIIMRSRMLHTKQFVWWEPVNISTLLIIQYTIIRMVQSSLMVIFQSASYREMLFIRISVQEIWLQGLYSLPWSWMISIHLIMSSKIFICMIYWSLQIIMWSRTIWSREIIHLDSIPMVDIRIMWSIMWSRIMKKKECAWITVHLEPM